MCMFCMLLFLFVSCSISPAHHCSIQKSQKGEGIGKIDAFSALDLLLGRCVEWADGGGRKEGIVSASWHQW